MISPVQFGIKKLASLFKSNTFSSVFVLVDENTSRHCLPLVKDLLPSHQVIKIKSGEKNKNLRTCELIWSALLTKHADKNSLLVNLGGGVITDMGAFCASLYKRGIAFIHVPTSLLAMADASLGGKTGVDFLSSKNMIGNYAGAEMVCIDAAFLKTLPQKQMISASAELFKHALLQNSQTVKKFLTHPFINFTEKEKANLIKKAVQFKESIVTVDPFEKNSRMQLNLGHTIGHALESYFLNSSKTLLHGEAVALGLVAEIFIAHTFYQLDYDTFLKVIFWYDLNFMKPDLNQINYNTIERFILNDKKNENQEIKMVMLESAGHYSMQSINHSQLREALQFLSGF